MCVREKEIPTLLSQLCSFNCSKGGRTFFLASNSPLTKYAQMYELLAETADMKAKYVEMYTYAILAPGTSGLHVVYCLRSGGVANDVAMEMVAIVLLVFLLSSGGRQSLREQHKLAKTVGVSLYLYCVDVCVHVCVCVCVCVHVCESCSVV